MHQSNSSLGFLNKFLASQAHCGVCGECFLSAAGGAFQSGKQLLVRTGTKFCNSLKFIRS